MQDWVRGMNDTTPQNIKDEWESIAGGRLLHQKDFRCYSLFYDKTDKH